MTAEPSHRMARPRWHTVFRAAGALLTAALVGATSGLLLAGADPGAAPNAADVGFAQDMTVHHRQAVTMSGWVRDHSTDPAVRQLAFDIETSQNEQIGRMQGWLALWSQPAAPTGGHLSWMHGPDHTGHDQANALMPGMATTAELARLRSLSGRELDIFFLRLMIRHHQGGGPMMRAAAARAAIPDVGNLARQMLTAQTADITAMTTMLTDRGAIPLPAPE